MFTLTRVTTSQEFLPYLELVNELTGDFLYFPLSYYAEPLIYPPLLNPRNAIFVIHVGSQPAGWCQFHCRGRTISVEGLYVRSSLRGHGIGRRTLHRLEFCAPQCADLIVLKVHRSNPRARRLYQRCGFVARNLEKNTGFFNMYKKRRSGMRCSLRPCHSTFSISRSDHNSLPGTLFAEMLARPKVD